MDFRSHRPTTGSPDYGHRRLVRLLLALGLVALLMREVRQPERWAWFTNLGGDSVPATSPEPQAPPAPETNTPHAPELGGESTAIDGEAVRADERALAAIRDNTPFQQEERDAWYGLFRELRNRDEASLREGAEPVTYVQLDQQPAAYRGQLVTLAGAVRRVVERAEPVANSNIARYYQVWLQPNDQLDSLVVIYCLELPEGFRIGQQLDEPARVVGFFFKRWAYNSQDGIRTAPLLLARTLDWKPRPAATPAAEIDRGLLWAIIGLVLAGAGITVWTLMRRGNEPSKYESYLRKDSAANEQLVPPEMEPSDESPVDFDPEAINPAATDSEEQP